MFSLLLPALLLCNFYQAADGDAEPAAEEQTGLRTRADLATAAEQEQHLAGGCRTVECQQRQPQSHGWHWCTCDQAFSASPAIWADVNLLSG